jgi:isoleucyl-tRNA synthetase
LSTFFNIEEEVDKKLFSRWNKVIKLREEINKALEIARNEKIIGHSLDANVIISINNKYLEPFGDLVNDFSALFIVSKVSFQQDLEEVTFNSEEIPGLAIKIEKAPGEKCERCWHYCPTVGDDEEFPSICNRCKKVLEELKLI